ncbi:MAG: hypothetical protein ABR573_09910 [Candidatus Dormibacteria bacterium]
MEKKFAAKNVRMGVLLTLVSILMGLIAWGWTALYLAFAVGK